MSRFRELLDLQYERKLTTVEQAALNMLSAEVTHNDRLGSFTLHEFCDSKARCDKLRAVYSRALSVPGDPDPTGVLP